MKAILEFTLPEEQDEHRLALDGGRWAGAMHAFDEELRKLDKYEGDKPVAPSKVREMLYAVMAEDGLEFD